MFINASLSVKILVVILSILLSLTLVWAFFQLTLSNPDFTVLWTFLICWAWIGVCFMYFQTFKYTRFRASWYRRHSIETDRFFQFLLVPTARKVITQSMIRRLNPRIYLKERSREQIRIVHEETRQSETSHLLSGLLALITQLILLISGHVLAFAILGLWNILFNGFPVLVQRMNRFAIERRFPGLY